MLIRKITLSLLTITLLGGVAGADCCSDKAEKTTTTSVRAGWFTASGTVVGASPEAAGECCKGLPKGSAECCKTEAGKSPSGDKAGAKCDKEAGACSKKAK